MDNPDTYAVIDNGVVTNLISLCNSNASEFPNAVCIDGRPVAIGDTYSGGAFYHEGVAL